MSSQAWGLAFVDCETTSLTARAGRIWEIAVILRSDQDEDQEHLFQIEGVEALRMDPESRRISRFDERYKKEPAATMVTAKSAAYMVHALLAQRHIVGANPAFDQAFIEALLFREKLRASWHHRLIDVEVLAQGYGGWNVPMGLTATSEMLGLAPDRDGEHTALGDARAARDVYDVVTNGRTKL